MEDFHKTVDEAAEEDSAGKPSFTKKPSIKQDGDLLIMECEVTANPAAKIAWFKGSDQVNEGGRFHMTEKSAGEDTYLLSLVITVSLD